MNKELLELDTVITSVVQRVFKELILEKRIELTDYDSGYNQAIDELTERFNNFKLNIKGE